MTMVDTLFGLIPSASTGQQWIARDLQVVNWGGYAGPHHLRLAATATLLAGGSGSGKSTLMDAYIALLMPHTTPFNGASNGGVVGRPRGKDQRNVISYARGKLDDSRTEEGTRERVLRGDKADTWTAVSLTWVDQGGAEFTALRAWYVPVGATNLDGLTSVRATLDGPLALARLESAAKAKFSRSELGKLELTCFDTDRDFSARVYSTLGIGAAGGGEKAVALLARIQAGQQITTVHRLYNDMVLEEPGTYAKAAEVVEHFDELAATREQMLTAREQVRALTPIREHRSSIEEARRRLSLVEAVGSPSDDTAPLGLWRAERRSELLRAVEDEAGRQARAATEQVRELEVSTAACRSELDGVRQTLWASGGDAIQQAGRELHLAEAALAGVTAARARVDAALGLLGVEVKTEKDYDRCASAAAARLADAGAKAAVTDAYFVAKNAAKDAERDLVRLTAERDSLSRRRGNMPEAWHRARLALAQAAGLREDELPFVAELVEVSTAHEQWREAFNLALGGFARTLLVDAAHLARFRSAIDGVSSEVRLNFEGVPTGLPLGGALDPGTLPGRLDFAGGPFEGWLRERLAERFAYVCVETPGQLGQHHKALTRGGQSSDGARGAHGGHGRANLLGFTNTRRLADLDLQMVALQEAAAVAAAEARGAGLRLDALDEQRAASQVLLDTTWQAIDVAHAQDQVERWRRAREAAKAQNPQLDDLATRAAELDAALADLQERLGRAKVAAETADAAWQQASEQVDATQAGLDAAEAAGTEVSATQGEYLTELLGTTADGGEPATPTVALAAFDTAVARAAERLRFEQEAATTALTHGADSLHATFEQFIARWPDPNLGTDPEASYADFERILATLETQRLHELEAEWRRALLRLSGADLTDLEHTLARARREITDRIGPVNEILAGLPFADDDHRLRIDDRMVQSAVVQRFRKELREVRELLADNAETTDEERQRRYQRMSRLVERIRPGSPERADLIDVRRHVRISAEKVDLEGNHVSLYDHIGEKSGGESQELVAFIVGAALRYQLGDAGAAHPRYAPVFLDEALIKADAQFSGRAIGAWRGLGFQLVVGAPNDKVSALEPHVDASYVVVKDAAGRSRARAVIGVD